MERLHFDSVNSPSKEANCDKHGAYTAKGFQIVAGGRMLWTHCPGCEQDRKDEEEKEKAAAKAAWEKQKWDELLGRSCIPKRFIEKTFETFVCKNDVQKNALEVSKSFAEQFQQHAAKGTGLIFLGKPGTGKSHLAAAIIQKLMPDYFGLYTTVGECIRAVRETWRRDSEQTERQVLNYFIYADLLVLDEVGVQYGTEGEKTVLFDILDGRYREMMPTILMGNVTAKELKDYIGERAADRLREINTAILFDWASYRTQARKDAE
ncbi:ATP-binding protein [Saezia sanguinis]|uniref:ATP-binding protein n=1 Tax=Saezia sanguinis TaxID=1965230 RepID=UPI003032A983